ncbi:MAG: regulatory iron-sulfur-containing complex subunit RicT [Cytophagales bacterium]|nr:regulatory iron-sulfur-containing complex subunit RicT [Cytophagales bacterium]
MGCSSCSTGTDGEVSGCRNNGGCSTGGCNKLNVFDWLSNMDVPTLEQFEYVEIRFKNGRKEFFRNQEQLELHTGDAVVVDVPNGHHIGHVSLQGELVRLQMKKKGVKKMEDIRIIYRLASPKDIDKFRSVKKREEPTLYRTREIIQLQKLQMKLTDVEYQADNSKATFYYSADDRVDFRELIKILASEFKIRVEMRQISLRQEASRIGGIGSCGRELCCSTWLSDFTSVTTQAARYQNLSLNPGKLSGQCGRLKCCLNYELDTYMDALDDIPKIEGSLQIENGKVTLQKTDIFRKIMWFAYAGENTWHPLETSRVQEIIALNKEGKKPATLLDDVEEEKETIDSLNSDLVAMDRKFKKSKKRNKNKKRRPNNKQGANAENKQQAKDKPQNLQGRQKHKQKPPNDKKSGNNQKSGNQQQGQQNQNPSNNQQSGNNQTKNRSNKKRRPKNKQNKPQE